MKTTDSNKSTRWVVSILGAALAVWAVVAVADADLSALSDLDLNWPAFVAVIPMYLGITIARGARIKIMTGSSESLWLLTGISSLHVLITKVFPFRTGEFFLPIMLKKYKVMGLTRGSGILVSIRLLDFLVLFTALFASSFLVRKDYFETYWFYMSLGLFACLALLLLVLFLVVKGPRNTFLARISLPAPMVRTGRWAMGLLGADSSTESDKPLGEEGPSRMRIVVAGGLLYTCISWFLVFWSFFFLLDWAGVQDLSFPAVILGSAGAIIAGFLPINTLLSLGTIEAGWTASLYLVGVDPALGVIAGFRIHGAIFFFNILFALGGYLLLRIMSRRREETDGR